MNFVVFMNESRGGGQSGGRPVSASRKRTVTSFATIEVSAHSASPIRNVRRLIVKLPLALETAPDGATMTGTTIVCVRPLIDSVPATSNLPPPRLLMPVDL